MLRYHMQNITETIYKFISECPLFEGKRVGLNCLGAESGACALETSAAELYVRVYTDGTAVRRAEFAFAVRGTPSRSVKENLPAVAVCEKLCACGNMVAVVLAQKGENLSYRVARSADVALSMRDLIQAVNALFGGKGGGRDDSAQGSAKLNGSAKDSVEQLKAYVYRRIKG